MRIVSHARCRTERARASSATACFPIVESTLVVMAAAAAAAIVRAHLRRVMRSRETNALRRRRLIAA